MRACHFSGNPGVNPVLIDAIVKRIKAIPIEPVNTIHYTSKDEKPLLESEMQEAL